MVDILESIVEKYNLPWNVDKTGSDEYSFRWYGGEADMEITLHGDSVEELAGDAYEQWQDFDPDYETSLWIGEDGHGKNGAPYRIRDILADFDKYDDDLEELALTLYRQNNTL